MGIQVAAYHVRVKERHARKHEMLDAIGGSRDFLTFVEDGLEKWKAGHHNDEGAGRVAKVQKVQRKSRVIQGRIQVGDYGQACDVIDANEALKVVFTKSVQHADMLPFFFRIEVPENRDEALFLIEKSRKTSPKTAFTKLLRNHFDQEFPEYTLSINPVMPEKVFQEYLAKGKVQKIEFIRMGIPDDIVDLLESGHQEIKGMTKLSITASRDRSLPIKKSILGNPNPRKAISDLYEIKALDYENVALTVKLGRNTRKIDLGSKHASPLYDITSNVKIGPDGSAIYASIEAAFESLANDINEGAYAPT